MTNLANNLSYRFALNEKETLFSILKYCLKHDFVHSTLPITVEAFKGNDETPFAVDACTKHTVEEILDNIAIKETTYCKIAFSYTVFGALTKATRSKIIKTIATYLDYDFEMLNNPVFTSTAVYNAEILVALTPDRKQQLHDVKGLNEDGNLTVEFTCFDSGPLAYYQANLLMVKKNFPHLKIDPSKAKLMNETSLLERLLIDSDDIIVSIKKLLASKGIDSLIKTNNDEYIYSNTLVRPRNLPKNIEGWQIDKQHNMPHYDMLKSIIGNSSRMSVDQFAVYLKKVHSTNIFDKTTATKLSILDIKVTLQDNSEICTLVFVTHKGSFRLYIDLPLRSKKAILDKLYGAGIQVIQGKVQL